MLENQLLQAVISEKLSKRTKIIFCIYETIVLLVLVLGFVLGSSLLDDYWASRYDSYVGWYNLELSHLERGTQYYHGVDIFLVIFIALVLTLFPLLILLIGKRKRKLTELSVSSTEVVCSYTAFIPIKKITMRVPIIKIDNVAAVNSLFSLFGGKTIRIGSTSSVIRIPYVTNADEVVAYLIDAIEKSKQSKSNQVESCQDDSVKNLKKLLELKEAGVITEEEFNQKKKEFLVKM